jgi:hypothetical protein
MSLSRSSAPLRRVAEQTLRPKQQDREEQAERHGIAHGRADVSD